MRCELSKCAVWYSVCLVSGGRSSSRQVGGQESQCARRTYPPGFAARKSVRTVWQEPDRLRDDRTLSLAIRAWVWSLVARLRAKCVSDLLSSGGSAHCEKRGVHPGGLLRARPPCPACRPGVSGLEQCRCPFCQYHSQVGFGVSRMHMPIQTRVFGHVAPPCYPREPPPFIGGTGFNFFHG